MNTPQASTPADQHSPATCPDQVTQLQSAGSEVKVDRVRERRDELKKTAWARMQRSPTAKLTCDEGNHLEITQTCMAGTEPISDAAATLIFNASLGSTDPAFGSALTSQIVNAVSGWEKPSPKDFGFALSVVQGIEPRDEIEGMLAAQMAMVHIAAMRFARNLICAETLPQRDSCDRTINKLTRTFAMQMDTLKRYRTGGEQKITVQHQHVTVNDGGQAVVGSVTHGGRGKEEK